MQTCEAILEAKDAIGFSATSPNEIDREIVPELRQIRRALAEIDRGTDCEYERRALADGALTQCRRAREYLACFGGSWELEGILVGLERYLMRRANGFRDDEPKEARAAA